MTVHKRRGSGYGWYYAGFALAAFGVVALIAMLATDSGSVEFTPWRSIAYLVAIAVIAGAIKLRSTRR
jgi:hypothetical protein